MTAEIAIPGKNVILDVPVQDAGSNSRRGYHRLRDVGDVVRNLAAIP